MFGAAVWAVAEVVCGCRPVRGGASQRVTSVKKYNERPAAAARLSPTQAAFLLPTAVRVHTQGRRDTCALIETPPAPLQVCVRLSACVCVCVCVCMRVSPPLPLSLHAQTSTPAFNAVGRRVGGFTVGKRRIAADVQARRRALRVFAHVLVHISSEAAGSKALKL